MCVCVPFSSSTTPPFLSACQSSSPFSQSFHLSFPPSILYSPSSLELSLELHDNCMTDLIKPPTATTSTLLPSPSPSYQPSPRSHVHELARMTPRPLSCEPLFESWPVSPFFPRACSFRHLSPSAAKHSLFLLSPPPGHLVCLPRVPPLPKIPRTDSRACVNADLGSLPLPPHPTLPPSLCWYLLRLNKHTVTIETVNAKLHTNWTNTDIHAAKLPFYSPPLHVHCLFTAIVLSAFCWFFIKCLSSMLSFS